MFFFALFFANLICFLLVVFLAFVGGFLACFWLPLGNLGSGILAIALPPIFWFFDPPAHVSAEGIAWIWDFCGSALAGNL
jgi:hypothetical protein